MNSYMNPCCQHTTVVMWSSVLDALAQQIKIYKAEKKNILVSGFKQIFYFRVGRSGEKFFLLKFFFYSFISMK